MDKDKIFNRYLELKAERKGREFDNTLPSIYKVLADETGMTYNAVRSRIRSHENYSKENKELNINEVLLSDLNKGQIDIVEFSKKHGISVKEACREIDILESKGYNIIENDNIYHIKRLPDEETKVYKSSWNGNKIIRFGLMGDTQFSSKYCQITHLHNFYDICEREGIEIVYNTGDIDEGEQMRQGHQYECYTQGADAHVDEIVKNYPKRTGIKTKFITGNHDHSIIKRCGYDIGNAISKERDDMEYLGQASALIYLTPNCTMELNHPIDGTAYAISYKIQKMIEAMSGGEKPNILAVGHYHKAEYLFYRNVHAVQTGCFQAQTGWMKGKSIAAMVGGWIIEIHVDEEGTITRFKPEFIPYYKSIKDDYSNWR